MTQTSEIEEPYYVGKVKPPYALIPGRNVKKLPQVGLGYKVLGCRPKSAFGS